MTSPADLRHLSEQAGRLAADCSRRGDVEGDFYARGQRDAYATAAMLIGFHVDAERIWSASHILSAHGHPGYGEQFARQVIDRANLTGEPISYAVRAELASQAMARRSERGA